MYRPTFFILLLFFWGGIVNAQELTDTSIQYVKDSLPVFDSVAHPDTANISLAIDTAKKLPVKDSMVTEKFQGDNFFINKRDFKSKEGLFYVLISLLLLFAVFNRLFPKYFNDLYRLFFRTTLNQLQIREQMIQTPLPSLLLNVFFVITCGFYLVLLFVHYKLDPAGNFWLLFFYCSLSISVIYLVKFLGLKISGWLYSAREAADAYIFTVFVINKMAGIFLLPLLILLAFTSGTLYSISLIISFCGLGALLVYRCLLAYSAIRKQISINPFHFIIYLFAFEIVPLLLIYKVLLVILNRTA